MSLDHHPFSSCCWAYSRDSFHQTPPLDSIRFDSIPSHPIQFHAIPKLSPHLFHLQLPGVLLSSTFKLLDLLPPSSSLLSVMALGSISALFFTASRYTPGKYPMRPSRDLHCHQSLGRPVGSILLNTATRSPFFTARSWIPVEMFPDGRLRSGL